MLIVAVNFGAALLGSVLHRCDSTAHDRVAAVVVPYCGL
jgi:hypothetical protein